MIVWSDKVRKPVEIFRAVSNELLKREIDIDGVIEIFNDGVEQGILLKIFDKYNPNVDMCIWAYLPTERDCNNQLKVLIGHHSDCTDNNMWQGDVISKEFDLKTIVMQIGKHHFSDWTTVYGFAEDSEAKRYKVRIGKVRYIRKLRFDEVPMETITE